MIAFAVLALAAPLAHSKPLVAHAAHSSGPNVESQSATEVSQQGATLRARIGTSGHDTWYRFEYGTTTRYGTATPVGHLGGDHGKADVASVITGLAPGTVYHFRAVAANDDDFATGPDATFTTAAPPAGSDPVPPPGPGATEPAAPPTFQPVPEPAMGRTVVVQVAAGTVLVKEQGSSEFRPLSTTDAMPVNSIIDARQGTVSLTTARGGGVSQAATFRGGMFQVRQSRTGKGMTDIFLRGGSFAACPKAGARSSRTASAAATRKVRRLWSSDHHGRFRTHGRNSVATVRGTSWYTEERCDGTLTRVRSGKVLVRERGTGRTKLVTRGHSFLARPPR